MREAHAMARWALSLPLRPAAGLLLPKLLLLLLLHAPVVPAPPLQQGLVRVESLGRKHLRPEDGTGTGEGEAGVRPSSRPTAPPSRVSGRTVVAWHPRVPPWGAPVLSSAPALQAWRWRYSRGVLRWAPEGPPTRNQAPPAAAYTLARRDAAFLETQAPLAPGLQVPRSIEDLKRLQRQLLGQLQAEPLRFVCAFSLLYVALQALTIPGSTILNVAAGCLFGFLPGLLLVTLLVTVGSLASYSLSALLLCQVLEDWMPARLDRLRSQVAAHRDGLLNYLLFLRLSPVIPSWFINAASPVAGVPWRVFALASLLGFLPHTSVQVHAGCVLSTISSLHDLYSIKVLVLLFLFSLLALVPTFLKANGSSTASRAVSP